MVGGGGRFGDADFFFGVCFVGVCHDFCFCCTMMMLRVTTDIVSIVYMDKGVGDTWQADKR